MLLPALAKAKSKAHQIACTSNLKQAGLAMRMWIDENNDFLPPGGGSTVNLTTGQKRYYNQTYTTGLITYLATYLGYPTPDAQNRPAPAFQCPGFTVQANDALGQTNGVCYVLTRSNPNLVTPFNWYDAPGCKESKMQSLTNYSDAWIMGDVDELGYGSAAPSGWGTSIPATPVHGTVRNFLFFDGHVTTRKAGAKGTF